jgi:hypothetical protein
MQRCPGADQLQLNSIKLGVRAGIARMAAATWPMLLLHLSLVNPRRRRGADLGRKPAPHPVPATISGGVSG